MTITNIENNKKLKKQEKNSNIQVVSMRELFKRARKKRVKKSDDSKEDKPDF